MSRLSSKQEENMKRCRFAVVFLCCSLLQLLGVQGAVVVSLLQTNYTVEENSGISVCFRVTGTPNSSSIELLFHAVGGTATEGVDYTLSSNHTLELPFPLLTGTSEQCFPVFQLCEDDVPENNESFTISVSVPPNTPSVFQQKNFTVTIIDNDRVEVSFTRGRYTVSEGEAVEICVETGASSERDFVPLSITTITGTAINADFYVSGVTFNQEDNQFQKCMTLTAVDDILPEQKEFFRISVSSSDNLVNIQHSTVKIYITDNDPVSFSLVQSVYEVEEGETARVCLEAAENDLPLIRFHLIVLDLGGNATGGDYTVDSEQYSAVGISSSSESHEICFDVATSDDAVSEGTEIETFQLLLSTDVSWVMLDIPHEVTVDIVILDNDVVEVEFEQSVYIKTEGAFPYLSLCLTVSGGVDRHPPPSLTINTNSRTAVGGSDYETSNHWFRLPESSYCHQLRIFDDTQPESEEFFDVCVTTESPLIHISTECVQVHIVDNDTPEVFWERLQYTVTESQGQVEVCAKLLGTLRNEAQVRITATDITAIDSYDYSIEEEQQVFVFGPLSPQRQCRHVDVVSDELMEETEVLRLSLSYTNSSEVVLNISHPHTTVHIQDTSSGYGCAEGGILLNSIPGDKESTSGLVEMCNSRGKWESVCDTEWSLNDTATICRQAGFHRPGEGVMSLESLQPAAATFTCTQTDSNLANCLGEKPENGTCRHLLVACVRENPVTSKNTPSPATEEFPTAETGSKLGKPAPSDSSQFPVVGVVVGVFSALLLVGVVTVVGVVSGAVLWRKRSKSLTIASGEMSSLEAPVYEVLEARGGTVTPSPPTTTTSSNCGSSQTSCDLYSEIPPLSATDSPSRAPAVTTNTTIPSLPSFYDVIRPHDEDTDAGTSATGETESTTESEMGEGVKEEMEREKCDGGTTAESCEKTHEPNRGNVYERTDQKSGGEGNLYESVSDPFSSLEASGEYSTLERRREYATLEPYTGTGGTLKLKQLGKREDEEMGERGAKEEEQYAHLNH